MTDIQSDWTIKYGTTKAQYDNCQSINEVAKLTTKLNRQATNDEIDTPMGAIKFFSQQRRDQLAQGVATSYDKHGMTLSTTDSSGRKSARKFS
jgi:hypothetical protein